MDDAISRIVVALDFPAAQPALDFVDRMSGRLRWVKVGLELYLAAGPGIVKELRDLGLEVFLDLKLHDIPNTVASAVRVLGFSGASLLTVHTLGGPAMLRAAQEAAAETSLKLLGVTILTSMDALQLEAVGVAGSPANAVARLANLASDAGLAGMVCSPLEIGMLRKSVGPSPLLVGPGIRPAGSAADDQSRTATPVEAVRTGASLLVIGRPLTGAAHPIAAFEQITASLQTSKTENP